MSAPLRASFLQDKGIWPESAGPPCRVALADLRTALAEAGAVEVLVDVPVTPDEQLSLAEVLRDLGARDVVLHYADMAAPQTEAADSAGTPRGLCTAEQAARALEMLDEVLASARASRSVAARLAGLKACRRAFTAAELADIASLHANLVGDEAVE